MSLAFLILFFGASIFSSSGEEPFAFKDIFQFVFFPIGLMIGLILAWNWEGLGGLIAIASIIGFHLQMLIKNGNPDFGIFFKLLAFQGYYLFFTGLYEGSVWLSKLFLSKTRPQTQSLFSHLFPMKI